MVDSIRVFDPGFRVIDQNGLPVPGALIQFFTAGTTTPLPVYSDSALTVSLGAVVTCDAYGAPASSPSTDVLIYTGVSAYKVVFRTSAGVLIPGLSFDNIKGALDTSTYGLSSTYSLPVVNISASGTTTNLGKLENINCTAQVITRTLPSAASATNGNYIEFRHDGLANAVCIVSQGADLIKTRDDLGGQNTLVLLTKGDAVALRTDGVDWHANFTAPINRSRVYVVQAIQTSPPSSPVLGDAYMITGTPTGAWSAFAANDIVTSNGNAGWTRARPLTNCGWKLFNVATGVNYVYFGSAWRAEGATDTVLGTFTVATAAEQASGSSVTAAVTPARQQNHKSAIKAWAKITGATGAIVASSGVTSVTRVSAGLYTFVFPAGTFADANYLAFGASATASGAAAATIQVNTSVTQTVTTVSIATLSSASAQTDFASALILFCGN